MKKGYVLNVIVICEELKNLYYIERENIKNIIATIVDMKVCGEIDMNDLEKLKQEIRDLEWTQKIIVKYMQKMIKRVINLEKKGLT